MNMIRIKPNTALAVLVSVVVVCWIALNILHFGDGWSLNEKLWWRDTYDLLNSFFVNLLAAYFFYLLIAQLFVQRRRKIIKANLQKQYRQFRESIIGHFIGAVNGSHSSKEVEQLYALPGFRDYFKGTDPIEGKDRWYVVLDRVQENEYLQHELIVELAVLRDEISFVLSTIEIHDEKIFDFFKRLLRIIYRHEHGQFDTDDFKSFMQFFYELFSGWSFITGYTEKDIVQSFIDGL